MIPDQLLFSVSQIGISRSSVSLQRVPLPDCNIRRYTLPVHDMNACIASAVSLVRLYWLSSGISDQEFGFSTVRLNLSTKIINHQSYNHIFYNILRSNFGTREIEEHCQARTFLNIPLFCIFLFPGTNDSPPDHALTFFSLPSPTVIWLFSVHADHPS